MRKAERNGTLGATKTRWRWMLFPLYASLLFISVRIFFRLAEFSTGPSPDNQLINKESYAYVFDAVPMFFAIIVWNISHPGRIIQGPDALLPSTGVGRIFCCCRGRNKERQAEKPASSEYSSSERVDVRPNQAMHYP
jgi:hypothetical protein